jgi:hypothetical protein
MNPSVSWAKPLVFFPWVAFNLLLAPGFATCSAACSRAGAAANSP